MHDQQDCRMEVKENKKSNKLKNKKKLKKTSKNKKGQLSLNPDST